MRRLCRRAYGSQRLLHSLVTEGVFLEGASGDRASFHALPPPTDGEVADVAWETCRRTRKILIRHGRWQDEQDEPLGDDTAPEGLADVYGRREQCEFRAGRDLPANAGLRMSLQMTREWLRLRGGGAIIILTV